MDKYQDLNFKVSPSYHRIVKITSATLGMSMIDIFREAFSLFLKAKYGETPPFDLDNDAPFWRL